jgi:thiosulfate/3-mercaptopyruvate sulfurtransferase
VFESAGVDVRRPVVTTCGSGVTACCLAFALDALGAPPATVYDGSWSEWAARSDTPIQR